MGRNACHFEIARIPHRRQRPRDPVAYCLGPSIASALIRFSCNLHVKELAFLYIFLRVRLLWPAIAMSDPVKSLFEAVKEDHPRSLQDLLDKFPSDAKRHLPPLPHLCDHEEKHACWRCQHTNHINVGSLVFPGNSSDHSMHARHYAPLRTLASSFLLLHATRGGLFGSSAGPRCPQAPACSLSLLHGILSIYWHHHLCVAVFWLLQLPATQLYCCLLANAFTTCAGLDLRGPDALVTLPSGMESRTGSQSMQVSPKSLS